MTLDEMLGRMTSAEFSGWLAYDEAEGVPWPWLQTGILTSNAVNLWSKKKRFTPWDFMPCRKPKPPKQSPSQLRRTWDRCVAAINAKFGKGP